MSAKSVAAKTLRRRHQRRIWRHQQAISVINEKHQRRQRRMACGGSMYGVISGVAKGDRQWRSVIISINVLSIACKISAYGGESGNGNEKAWHIESKGAHNQAMAKMASNRISAKR